MSKDFVVTENDKEINLTVKTPSLEDIEASDRVYAAKIASLIREDKKKKLLLRSELDTFLRDSGVWTKTDEDKVFKLRKDIDTLLGELRKGGKKLTDGRTAAIAVMDKRNEIFTLMRKRQIFDDATIESVAENEKAEYFIYACTVYSETGDNYWSSFEDMKNDRASEVYRKASELTLEVVFGNDPDLEKKLPENKWLKKYGFIDENLNYTDRKTGKFVDREGKPLPNIEEQAAKIVENLVGDIKEETPFIDDDTNEPVTPNS